MVTHLVANILLLIIGVADASHGTFRAVPPAESGITWKHDNAMSKDRFLPETEPPGVAIFDYDNDGLRDLIIACGHPDDLVDMRSRGVTAKEPLRLFHNDGKGKMVDVSDLSGEAFLEKHWSRRLAMGDLNNDGYPDLVVGVNGEAPLLLMNNGESKNNWIGLDLTGTSANPAATGAIIKWSFNGVVRSAPKAAGGSFMSSHDPRKISGLGSAQRVEWLEIHWPKPSSRVDRFTDLSVNRHYVIKEGTGIRDQ